MNKVIENNKNKINDYIKQHDQEIENLKKVIKESQEKLNYFEEKINEASKREDLKEFKKLQEEKTDCSALLEMSNRKLEMIKSKNESLEKDYKEIKESIKNEQNKIYDSLKKDLVKRLKEINELLNDARSDTETGNECIRIMNNKTNISNTETIIINSIFLETNDLMRSINDYIKRVII